MHRSREDALVPETRSRRRFADSPESVVSDENGGSVADETVRRRPERLRRSEDFRQALRRGRRARHPLLHLVARRTQHPVPRVGLAVGKRVGGAVTRNRIKRRLRMIVQDLPWRTSADIVLLVQPAAASASYHDLYAATGECARRLDLLMDEQA